jgi:hypothetical protein
MGASFLLTKQIYYAAVARDLGYKSVLNAIKRSNHKVSITKKRCQATTRNQLWKQACLNTWAQLLVQFRETMPEDTDGAIVNNSSLIKRELIKKEGLKLAFDQIGWWDEKHIPQVCGEINRETLISFLLMKKG